MPRATSLIKTKQFKAAGGRHTQAGNSWSARPGKCVVCKEKVNSLGDHYRKVHQATTTVNFPDQPHESITLIRKEHDGLFHCPRCSFSHITARRLQDHTKVKCKAPNTNSPRIRIRPPKRLAPNQTAEVEDRDIPGILQDSEIPRSPEDLNQAESTVRPEESGEANNPDPDIHDQVRPNGNAEEGESRSTSSLPLDQETTDQSRGDQLIGESPAPYRIPYLASDEGDDDQTRVEAARDVSPFPAQAPYSVPDEEMADDNREALEDSEPQCPELDTLDDDPEQESDISFALQYPDSVYNDDDTRMIEPSDSGQRHGSVVSAPSPPQEIVSVPSDDPFLMSASQEIRQVTAGTASGSSRQSTSSPCPSVDDQEPATYTLKSPAFARSRDGIEPSVTPSDGAASPSPTALVAARQAPLVAHRPPGIRTNISPTRPGRATSLPTPLSLRDVPGPSAHMSLVANGKRAARPPPPQDGVVLAFLSSLSRTFPPTHLAGVFARNGFAAAEHLDALCRVPSEWGPLRDDILRADSFASWVLVADGLQTRAARLANQPARLM